MFYSIFGWYLADIWPTNLGDICRPITYQIREEFTSWRQWAKYFHTTSYSLVLFMLCTTSQRCVCAYVCPCVIVSLVLIIAQPRNNLWTEEKTTTNKRISTFRSLLKRLWKFVRLNYYKLKGAFKYPIMAALYSWPWPIDRIFRSRGPSNEIVWVVRIKTHFGSNQSIGKWDTMTWYNDLANVTLCGNFGQLMFRFVCLDHVGGNVRG